jgi:hypothetical protein
MAGHRITYEFKGGPLDGQRTEGECWAIPDGMIGEVSYRGGHLYRTNGPVDVIATEIDLDYVGKATPSYHHPRVVVRHYEVVE